MPVYGSDSDVGFAFQNSYGTVATIASSAQTLPVTNFSIGAKRPHIIQENMRGVYDEGESALGLNEVSGEIEMEAHPISIGYLLGSFFGSATVTTSDSIYKHSWQPEANAFDGIDGDSFKRPATISQNDLIVGQEVNYYNLVSNTLELSITNGELLKTRASFVGGRDDGGTAGFSAAFPADNDRFTWDVCSFDMGEAIGWTERTTALTASDAAANDYYGITTAISGDGLVLAVGAYAWEGASGTNRGAVYIYDWNGSAWVERSTILTASDAADNDGFGRSVALSDDGAILAVGAFERDGGGSDRGAVYVFDWNGSSWTERTTALTASDAANGDRFGVSCALSSDGTILSVGSYYRDFGGGSDQGAVYIYDWNGSAWVERSTILTASDAGNNDNFGVGCSLSGDGSILAVGAFTWDGSAGSNQGAVYIFDWDGSNWTERTTALTASDAGANDLFGGSCALSNDGSILAVGALDWDGGAGGSQGAVYVFDWNGSSWDERTAALTASDAAASDLFGAGVSLSSDGEILSVGAYNWEGANTNQGAVYVYDIQELNGHALSEFTVTFEDPIEPRYYMNNSVWPAKNVLTGNRKISFSGVMHYENNSFYQEYIDKNELKIQMTLEDRSTEIQSGYYNKLYLKLYRAKIETSEANASGAGETMLSFSGNAHYSPYDSTNMELTLTNTKSAY